MSKTVIPFSHNQKELFLEFVRNWIRLLADNRLDEACELLETNEDGIVWTADKVLRVVNQTFNPQSRFYQLHPEGPKFTAPDGLLERGECQAEELNDKTGYWMDYDIPLNGECSDLTAQFVFYKQENGYCVVLHDLHVL